VTIRMRIAVGAGCLLALLLVVLVYHVLVMRRMMRINSTLAGVTFRAAELSLSLLRQRDAVEEYARKYYVTHDPDYATLVADARDGFAAELAQLGALPLPDGERAAVDALAQRWRSFPLASRAAATIGPWLDGLDEGSLQVELAQPLEAVRKAVWSVLNTTRDSIAAQVERSRLATRRAEATSLAVAAAGLGLALLVVVLTVRSITAPLGRLAEGTRAVAEGRFSTQLPTDGRDELSGVAEDFNAMVRRLDELDRVKRSFVSHVSHELRTPLVAMQETTRLLLEESVGPLTARQRRLLELNLQGAQRLSAMIANLLDLSRIEAGVMEYRMGSHDLAALVEGAAAQLEVWAREQGVELVLHLPEEPVIARCDPDRVAQVVGNLLSNAIKFSPAGCPVEASVDLHREPSRAGRQHARITVMDRGPGIPVQEREAIFQEFRRLDATAGTGGAGVGLGLAIARQIVRAHDGAILVRDNPGGGSVFTVLLPLGAVDQSTGRAS
jgi:signal transduction histidine kinase